MSSIPTRHSMSISTPVCYNLTTIWPLGAMTNVLRLADVRKKIIWANISSSVHLSSLTVRLETWDTRMKLRDDESLWTDTISAYEWSSFQNSKVKINCYQPQQPYSCDWSVHLQTEARTPLISTSYLLLQIALMCRYIYRDYIEQQTRSEFCSRFLPVERQLFFSVLSPSARWWMLGLCKYINWRGWSRPAPVWKCCEITFVVEWWYEFKDGWLVGWF